MRDPVTSDVSARGPARWRHPIFALLGVRPVYSEHTSGEDKLLREWACRSLTIVELGVAEGGSAWSMRLRMPAQARLVLVDPYVPGRLPIVTVKQLVAHRLVASVPNGSVRWVRQLSWNAGRQYNGSKVDLLFIDADHRYESVRHDWEAWSPHIGRKGAVVFHDSRTFQGGWLTDQDGPVRLVEQILAEGLWIEASAVDSARVLVRRLDDG